MDHVEKYPDLNVQCSAFGFWSIMHDFRKSWYGQFLTLERLSNWQVQIRLQAALSYFGYRSLHGLGKLNSQCSEGSGHVVSCSAFQDGRMAHMQTNEFPPLPLAGVAARLGGLGTSSTSQSTSKVGSVGVLLFFLLEPSSTSISWGGLASALFFDLCVVFCVVLAFCFPLQFCSSCWLVPALSSFLCSAFCFLPLSLAFCSLQHYRA